MAGPRMLRHAFITAAVDAGVPLRDGQEAASHADPRTTMRYDRARTSLDRHAACNHEPPYYAAARLTAVIGSGAQTGSSGVLFGRPGLAPAIGIASQGRGPAVTHCSKQSAYLLVTSR